LAVLVCIEPIKHFYYYGDLAGFARCGHSSTEWPR
jgi:hypothetical protein